MYKGILVYRGTSLAEKTAILPTKVRKKMEFIIKESRHLSYLTFIG